MPGAGFTHLGGLPGRFYSISIFSFPCSWQRQHVRMCRASQSSMISETGAPMRRVSGSPTMPDRNARHVPAFRIARADDAAGKGRVLAFEEDIGFLRGAIR